MSSMTRKDQPVTPPFGYFGKEKSLSSAVSTESSAVTTDTDTGKDQKPFMKKHLTHDLDDDDELGLLSSGDEHASSSSRSSRLSIHDEWKPPDDAMLFSLTKKEELVYRRSIQEMRWEEQQNIKASEYDYDDDYDTGDTTDSEVTEAASMLWERLGPARKNAPMISINDRQASLSHLEPQAPSSTSFTETSDFSESYNTVFDNKSRNSSDSDDPVQAIFDLLDESTRRRKENAESEQKHSQGRSKMWFNRLIVVILLNFLMRFRRKFVSFNEIMLPILISVVLLTGMVVNSEGGFKYGDDAKGTPATFSKDEIITTESIFYSFCGNAEYCGKKSDRSYYIVFSPNNRFVQDLMNRTLDFLDIRVVTPDSKKFQTEEDISAMIGVNNSAEVESLCQAHWKSFESEEEAKYGPEAIAKKKDRHQIQYTMGLIFSFEGGLVTPERMESIGSNKDIPKTLTYTIRTYYPQVANTVEGFPFREHVTRTGESQKNPYLQSGIIGMQMAIDFAYAEMIVEKSVKDGNRRMKIGKEDPTFVDRVEFFRLFRKQPSLKQFEYPTYKGPQLRVRGWVALTMVIILSFVVADMCVSQDIIHEQQSGSIELLKIHGMTTSMRWVANLIITGILRSITTIPIAFTIQYYYAANAVTRHPYSILLWYFLWSYSISVTCFNYFITTGFGIQKTELAGMVVICMGFLSAFLPLHLFQQGYLKRMTNLVLCFLFPQWNLANGLYFYLRYEIYEEGLEWFDFPVMIDTKNHLILPLTVACPVFWSSTAFYLGLTIYMDHILSREFSPKENWLFCLKAFTRKPPSQTSSTRPIPKAQKPTVYEHGPRDATFGPRLRNVTLTDGKSAELDNISFDTYEGEVTCIVGQVGSGKSDLLNVIAGVSVPSEGFVDVKGHRVHEYHDITNRYVSLCPLKSLLLDTLSVEDHIRLCCMLHGASYGKAKMQAAFLLKMFGLNPMRRHNFGGLTVSDTKKLMVAMALSKSPSVLLLDNPIDQLDSESTLEFWKLLQELKPQRTIIVTCTKLEEAELYGDRIAVLSRGKLVCYGTPAYIKLAYGLGSIINLQKVKDAEVNLDEIQKVMNSELNGAKAKILETKGISLQNDTVKFILPYGKFCAGVLEKLEDNMTQLNIARISMSQPNLWALYHKIASHSGIERMLAHQEAKILRGVNSDEHLDLEAATLPPIPVRSEKDRGCFSVTSTLVRKKIWYYRQMYWTTLLPYICQLTLTLALVYFSHFFLSDQPEMLPKMISSRMYINNLVLVRSADNEHTRDAWMEAYKHALFQDDSSIHIRMLNYHDDIERYLATGTVHSLTQYKKQTIVSFSRDKLAHIGYYSSNSIHSPIIASHIMMQAFLYMISPDRDRPYSSVVVSHPFTQYAGFPASSTQSNSSTILGVFLALILSLLSAPVLRLIMNERNTRFKMLQRLAGVSAYAYWLSHGIADIMMYVIITGLCCSLMFFLDAIGYHQFEEWTGRAPLIYIFLGWLCWAAIPYTYFICSVVSLKKSRYGMYLLLLFATGIIPKIATYQFFRLYISGIVRAIRYVFYIFPAFSLTSACIHYFHILGDEKWCKTADKTACEVYKNVSEILKQGFDEIDRLGQGTKFKYIKNQISFNDTFRTCCREYCELAGTCHQPLEFFPDWDKTVIPGLKHDMYAILLNGVVFWILVILVEHRVLQNVYERISTKLCGNLERNVAERDVKATEEPEDVKTEHQKVDFMVEIEGDVDSEIYLVQDVTKFYAYTKGLDHIFFSVPINTVTGILGLPKTGKTTLLEVLTAQETPSSGYIYKDNDLLDSKSKKQLLLDVGYCPQKSCLLPYLTGAQMLTIMGRLRGLSSRECEQHVHWWLKLFGMEDMANKKCYTFRRGEDRRLCCALALIGDTRLIIIDEPTAFMDNMEKYLFWNVMSRISAATTLRRTILFASDDADEVQQQSSKVLVLEAGSIVAVGQLTEIFKNNNQGMLLAIRYGVSQYKRYTDYQRKVKVDRLKDHVIQYLSPCALMDEQDNLLIYHLKDQTLKLSRVYGVMEGAKVRFPSVLEHFQVFEQSLDDVILQLHKARNKRQEEVSAASTTTSAATTQESRITTLEVSKARTQ